MFGWFKPRPKYSIREVEGLGFLAILHQEFHDWTITAQGKTSVAPEHAVGHNDVCHATKELAGQAINAHARVTGGKTVWVSP